MLERFVFLKLKEEWATDQGRADFIMAAREVLPQIPGVQTCHAGIAADTHAAKGWDIAIRLGFATLADIESYRDHADHQAFLDTILSPKVEARRSWNFEMQDLQVDS